MLLNIFLGVNNSFRIYSKIITTTETHTTNKGLDKIYNSLDFIGLQRK